MRQNLMRTLWALFSCLLVVLSLLVGKQYLPVQTPANHHAPVITIPDETPSAEEPELPDNPVDFAALQAEFPEAVAWIRVPDTPIDYAVMQSGTKTNEDFYLTHNEAGEETPLGSIYIQKYNHADFSDPNTILYGHNMASGRMFAALHKYKSQSFFDNNPLIYVYTPGHARAYRIYSMFTYNETHLMADFDFSSDKGFEKFLQYTLNPKSYTRLVREGVRPTAADRVITLSTCTNDGNGRVLLVAVLEEDVATQ